MYLFENEKSPKKYSDHPSEVFPLTLSYVVHQKEEDDLQSLTELTSVVSMEVYRALHFYNNLFEE